MHGGRVGAAVVGSFVGANVGANDGRPVGFNVGKAEGVAVLGFPVGAGVTGMQQLGPAQPGSHLHMPKPGFSGFGTHLPCMMPCQTGSLVGFPFESIVRFTDWNPHGARPTAQECCWGSPIKPVHPPNGKPPG